VKTLVCKALLSTELDWGQGGSAAGFCIPARWAAGTRSQRNSHMKRKQFVSQLLRDGCKVLRPGSYVFSGQGLDKFLDFPSTQVTPLLPLLLMVEELAHPMRIERAASLFHPQFFEHLEIPCGPPRVGIKRSDLSPLQLLAIIHILHPHIVYHQDLTPMIANSRSLYKQVFCCFCVVFCLII